MTKPNRNLKCARTLRFLTLPLILKLEVNAKQGIVLLPI